MKTTAAALVCTLIVAGPLLAREKSDVIVMQNGDRLTGEIKKVEADTLYISLDYGLGTVSVQWSKVAHVESQQLFIVETENGSVYTGSICTAETPPGKPVAIRIARASGEEVVIERSRVFAIDQTAATFWRRLSGNVDSGAIYSKGNNTVQYSLGLNTTYLGPLWTAKAGFTSSLSGSSGVASSTRNQVSLSYYRRLRWSNWFWAGLGTFLQSSEQQIQLQSSLGGGLGRYLQKTERVRLAVLLGAAWQATNYESSAQQPTENVAAAVVGGSLEVSTFDRLSLNLTATLLPAVSEAGRVRFNTNASCYLKLFGKLTWNFSFYGNWDNRPPAGVPGSDYGLSSGLGVTFGK